MFGSSKSWGLNSTHLHGTHVPVEEPSTASKADMCGAKEHVRFGPIADILVSGMSARGRRELSQVGLHALKPCADPCLELCVYYWAVLWGGLKVDGPDDNTKTVEGFENLDGSPV